MAKYTALLVQLLDCNHWLFLSVSYKFHVRCVSQPSIRDSTAFLIYILMCVKVRKCEAAADVGPKFRKQPILKCVNVKQTATEGQLLTRCF